MSTDAPRPNTPADTTPTPPGTPEDPYLWLEDIHGTRAMDWVESQNATTRADFCDADFDATAAAIESALDSEDRIPGVSKVGGYYYNFWRDAAHPRGLWRRTTWASYLTEAPEWDVLLDVDALAAADGVDWVFHGTRLRRPNYDRALIHLSPDGGDAHTIREFDVASRTFVGMNGEAAAGAVAPAATPPAAATAELGFVIPTAKGQASWLDDDTLLVATDFGPGSMTESSYPASARVLKRGQDLRDAMEVDSVPLDELEVSVGVDHTPGFERVFIIQAIDFYNFRLKFAALPDFMAALAAGRRPEFTPVDVPTDVSVDLDRDQLLFRPRTDWQDTLADGTSFRVEAGALAVVDLADFLAGRAAPQEVFVADAQTSLQGWSLTRNYILLGLLRDVQSVVRVVARDGFTSSDLPGVPKHHTVSVGAVDPDDPATGDDYWLTVSGFTTPTTLARGTLGAEAASPAMAQPIKAGPALFDAAGLRVTQHFATSADGTRVPYFQVAADDIPLDGKNPVYQDGYGGFELSRLPGYAPTAGLGWLARVTGNAGAVSNHTDGEAAAGSAQQPAGASGGPADAAGSMATTAHAELTSTGLPAGRRGVYVMANIRGGGEYGPGWHTAALREQRHRAYEDYAAVAQDLVDRGVTSRKYLACAGGSNGGLLVGNMLVSYPEKFGAISCGVPLLDMRRYTKLSAGASWMAEYGDPDTADWDFIQTFSPYHVFDTARRPQREYPPVLFWTATSDDRVGPVQARKMAAKMEDAFGGAGRASGVWFFEDTAGGHSAAADNKQAAATRALTYRFLWKQLTGE